MIRLVFPLHTLAAVVLVSGALGVCAVGRAADAPAAPEPLPQRFLLDKVPYVGFDLWAKEKRAESACLPACLRAALVFLGDEVDYTHLMGVSGAAFRLQWHSRMWFGGNQDTAHLLGKTDKFVGPLMESLGWSYELLERDPGKDQQAEFRRRIVSSLAESLTPVIAFGVVGPPEACIVSGYDRGGEVLIGRSFFQDRRMFPEFAAGSELEPSGCFRKADWYKNTHGLILLTGQGEPPAPAKVRRDALLKALQVMQTPQVGEYHNGLAAFDAWAKAMGDDAQFTQEQELHDRQMCHMDASGAVAEGRHYGALFLRRMAQEEPAAAAELEAAAALFKSEHDLMWKMWALSGGPGMDPARARKLAEPGVRKKIVPLIQQAKELDAQAAGHLEKALQKLAAAGR